MRFERLYLKAYGPFTARVVDLPRARGGDLQILYGPNEAGKSTVLGGVTDFLFGFGHRSEAAFVHEHKALRVGAALALDGAEVLHALRRKGRKHTLFPIDAASGEEITATPLDEQVLARQLQGLDRDLYRHLFGLDLEHLVAGGRALLAGEGEVGQSLFQAAAGVASLKTLGDALAAEAAALFKPRGTTGTLNVALREYEEQRRVLREATVRTGAWEQAERELQDARARYEHCRNALAGARARREQLARIASNLPLIAERAAVVEALEALHAVPELAPDAGERRAAAQARLRSATRAHAGAEAELERLQAAAARIHVPAALLEQAAAIERLYREIGACARARERRGRQHATREQALAQARAILAEVAPGTAIATARELLPAQTVAARITDLAGLCSRLEAEAEAVEREMLQRRAALERTCAQRAALPAAIDLATLQPRLAEFERVAALADRAQRGAAEAEALRAGVSRAAAALGHAEPERLARLAVPVPQVVADFESEFAALDEAARLLEEQQRARRQDLERVRQALEALRAGGEVVTQAEVAAARRRRDGGWALVRRVHIDGAPGGGADEAAAYAGTGSLADAFEAAIAEADRLADLLHADVERATRAGEARQRVAQMEAAQAQDQSARQALAVRRAELERRWAQVLAPLGQTDLGPAAAREWLHRHAQFSADYERLGRLEAELASLQAEQQHLARVAAEALASCGAPASGGDETLAAAVQRLRGIATAAADAAARRQGLDEQIEAAGRELDALAVRGAQARAALEKWRAAWAEAVTTVHLPATASVAEARVRLDQLHELRAALATLADAERELAALEATVSAFEREAQAVAAAAGEPFAGGTAEQAVEALHAALAAARSAAQARRETGEAIASRELEREQARRERQAAEQELEALVLAAGCATVQALPEIEARAQDRRDLRQRLDGLERTLVQQNACPVADVVAAAAAAEPEGVARDIAALDLDLERLDAEVQEANTALVEARQRFEAMDGGARAAEAQQELASLAARIAGAGRACARARLAGAVLERVVQRYRERHQGPLLSRAAQIFAALTAGSFAGLDVDYDDERQVILGVRPGGARVSVAGMSQGTRDQLYLALRLATIEHHLAGRGPFPVIIDDLLVQFDDERALAALRELLQLARRTQVLFFTHHRHLLELARAGGVVPPALVHEL